MRVLKRFGGLMHEFFDFAWQNKAWWVLPIVMVLLTLTAMIATSASVAPYLYTLW